MAGGAGTKQVVQSFRTSRYSPLEGSGFELPVPRCALIANSAALVAPPDSAVRGGSLNGRLDVARYTATVLKDSEPSLTWVLGLRPEVFERAGAAQISGPSLPRRRDLQYPCRLLPWPAEVRVGAPFSRPRLAEKGCWP